MLKEHVLSVFSEYCPYPKWVMLSEANRIHDNRPGQPLYMYQIPLKPDEHIVDILEVLFGPYSILVQEYGLIPFNSMGAIDQVIANSYADAIRSLQVHNTWNFIQPDKLLFDLSLEESDLSGGHFCVVNYTVPHENLDTIDSDHYNLCFKKMALGQTMLWLAAMRSKYENLATPFGQVPLNWQQLQADGRQMLEECNQYLSSLPPDKLLEVF